MKNLYYGMLFAVQFLTRIPIPVSITPGPSTAGCALVCFPLVGWLLGALLLVLWLLTGMVAPLQPLTAAVMIVAAEAVLTGAFHLDGLADTFDAFMSPGTGCSEKLDIMKDSRIGVMGAVALVLCLLLKTALLTEILGFELPAAHAGIYLVLYPAVGRWAQVVCYAWSPYVREGGIGSVFSRAAGKPAVLLATLWMLPIVLHPAPGSLLTFVFVCLFLFAWRQFVHRQIGGITGDTLGAASVLAEIVFLAAAVVFRSA